MALRTETSRGKRRRGLGRGQAGQASLEMILLLMVGLLIGLGLVYRFNTAFKKYTVDMYGTYYRCLLETGELPGVGSVCKDKQARFAIANGKALVESSGGGSSSGSGGSGGSGSSGGGKGGSGGSSSGSSKSSSGGDGDSSGGGGGAESVGNAGTSSGGGTGSVIGRLRSLGKTRSTAVGSTADLSKDDASRAGAGGSKINPSGSRSQDGLRRAQTKMAFSMDGGQYQRSETSAVTAVSASAKSKTPEKAGDSLRPRKVAENTDRKPAAKAKEDTGGGLEFGKLFRLFLIFAIIVAIVVFLGGQVLQISKSSEK